MTYWRANSRLWRTTRHLSSIAFVALVTFSAFGQGVSPSQCGRLENPLGPFDYRKARFMTAKGEYVRPLLLDVEINHFVPEIENLTSRGNAYFGGDLNYLLQIFPNHHRALATMVRLGKKERTESPKGARYVVECYFERALRFVPDDHIVRGLYAAYLMDAGRKTDAEFQLDRAAHAAQGIAIAQHNVGLLYVLNGNYDKALRQASVAHGMGFDITRLKRSLQEKGAWKDNDADQDMPKPANSTPPNIPQ